MIMASDGVWDVVSNKVTYNLCGMTQISQTWQQAVEIAIKHEDPQKVLCLSLF